MKNQIQQPSIGGENPSKMLPYMKFITKFYGCNLSYYSHWEDVRRHIESQLN